MDKEEREKYHRRGIWVDKDGFLVPLKDASDERLDHLAKFLVKIAHKEAVQTVIFYATGPMPTADGALMAYEQEQAFVFENQEDLWALKLADMPIFKPMCKEVERRVALQSWRKIFHKHLAEDYITGGY